MMEKMIALQQKRRSKKGGFTLVELIVVLVILAILAALLIPALTGCLLYTSVPTRAKVQMTVPAFWVILRRIRQVRPPWDSSSISM